MDIGSLIQKATKVPVEGANQFVVNESLLSPIKRMCKADDQALHNAFHYLSVDLKRNNGCIRMRSLFIINELFQRSKVFRKEVSLNISSIIGCAGLLHSMSGELDNISLAKTFRVEVDNRVKELIEIWDSAYGMLYPEIHAVARYFRETLKLKMPNIEARRSQTEAEALKRIEQEQNVVLLQSSKIVAELRYTSLQVTNIVNRIEECFNILFPRLFSDDHSTDAMKLSEESEQWTEDNFDDIDWIESDESAVKSSNPIGNSSSGSCSSSGPIDLEIVGAVPYTIAFTLDTTAQDVTTADNDILISIVQELSKQLVNHVVPRLLQWKVTLTKALDIIVSGDGNQSSSVTHKRKFDEREGKEAETRAALHTTRQLLDQVHTVLIRKCKELLKTSK